MLYVYVYICFSIHSSLSITFVHQTIVSEKKEKLEGTRILVKNRHPYPIILDSFPCYFLLIDYIPDEDNETLGTL